jgi:O-antigen/teichoic acid export membrane protein
LPIVLVRCLEPEAFGQYRLLWLVIGTVMAGATLAMPASLFYFLPRADSAAIRRLYVNQTVLYLTVAGLISALAVGPWNRWLPDTIGELSAHGLVVPAVTILWVVASLLDLLPTIEERIRWQAGATIGLAVLRAAGLAIAAIVSRDLGVVLLVLLAFVGIKLVVLLCYIAQYHRLLGPLLRWPMFAHQLRYAAPFGAAGALYLLRVPGDQWAAAALFPVAVFASFSIGAVLAPMLDVFRQAVSTAVLPSMSRAHADGNIGGAIVLNSQANVLTAFLAFPLLAFAFVFAEDLVAVVYTDAYLAAAPVIRLYIVGLVALIVELATVTLILRQGHFVLWLNAATLIGAVALSWYGAQRFGLAGAAAGSVAAAWVDRALTLGRVARITGIPVARLQDWPALVRLLVLALAAATLARVAVLGFDDTERLWRLPAGALVLGVVYGVCWLWLRGQRYGSPQRVGMRS